jgi:hypothetical protein
VAERGETRGATADDRHATHRDVHKAWYSYVTVCGFWLAAHDNLSHPGMGSSVEPYRRMALPPSPPSSTSAGSLVGSVVEAVILEKWFVSPLVAERGSCLRAGTGCIKRRRVGPAHAFPFQRQYRRHRRWETMGDAGRDRRSDSSSVPEVAALRPCFHVMTASASMNGSASRNPTPAATSRPAPACIRGGMASSAIAGPAMKRTPSR